MGDLVDEVSEVVIKKFEQMVEGIVEIMVVAKIVVDMMEWSVIDVGQLIGWP